MIFEAKNSILNINLFKMIYIFYHFQPYIILLSVLYPYRYMHTNFRNTNLSKRRTYSMCIIAQRINRVHYRQKEQNHRRLFKVYNLYFFLISMLASRKKKKRKGRNIVSSIPIDIEETNFIIFTTRLLLFSVSSRFISRSNDSIISPALFVATPRNNK